MMFGGKPSTRGCCGNLTAAAEGGMCTRPTRRTRDARRPLRTSATAAWSAERVRLSGTFPEEDLPRVLPSIGRFCNDRTGAARRGDARPAAGSDGDSSEALFGQACVTPGMTRRYGTGSFVPHQTWGRTDRSRVRTACLMRRSRVSLAGRAGWGRHSTDEGSAIFSSSRVRGDPNGCAKVYGIIAPRPRSARSRRVGRRLG